MTTRIELEAHAATRETAVAVRDVADALLAILAELREVRAALERRAPTAPGPGVIPGSTHTTRP